MQAQQTLMVMAGRDKATGQRVWAVQSTSGTKAAGYPVFHVLTWDAERASWVCPCLSRKPCVHMRLASDASKSEMEQVIIQGMLRAQEFPGPDHQPVPMPPLGNIVRYDTEPIMARNDSGPRLYREPPLVWRTTLPVSIKPAPKPLAERQREVM